MAKLSVAPTKQLKNARKRINKLKKSPVGKLTAALGKVALAGNPRYQAAAGAVRSANHAVSQVKKARAVGITTATSVATNMMGIDTENYTFQVIRDPYAASGQFQFLVTPADTINVNNCIGVWDPKIAADSAKFKHFRVKAMKLMYNGGLASTTNGTIYFGSSRNPSTATPTSTQYAFLEKSAKCSVTDPYSFSPSFDPNWKAIDLLGTSYETPIGILTDICSGIVFAQFALNTATANDYNSIKFDLQLTLEYKGRNPDFSNPAIHFDIPNNNAGDRTPTFPVTIPALMPRSSTTTTETYDLPLGGCYVCVLNYTPDTQRPTWDILDSTGASVYTARRWVELGSYGTNGESNIRSTDGAGGTTTIRALATGWSNSIEQCFFFFKHGDVLRVTYPNTTGTDIATSVMNNIIIKPLPLGVLKQVLARVNPLIDANSIVPVV